MCACGSDRGAAALASMRARARAVASPFAVRQPSHAREVLKPRKTCGQGKLAPQAPDRHRSTGHQHRRIGRHLDDNQRARSIAPPCPSQRVCVTHSTIANHVAWSVATRQDWAAVRAGTYLHADSGTVRCAPPRRCGNAQRTEKSGQSPPPTRPPPPPGSAHSRRAPTNGR